MGRVSGYVCGQNYIKRFKLGATFTVAQEALGIPMLMGATGIGIGPCSTTAAANATGLCVAGATAYATTTNSAGAPEGTCEVDINPFAIIEMTANGGATNGTALSVITNGTGESAGTTLVSAQVAAADMKGGLVWRYSNGVGGESRGITTHTGSTSLVVTVPFSQDIALNDTFLMCPWNDDGTGAASGDGISQVQLTTTLDQADATIASGTGIAVVVIDVFTNGITDSAVRFMLDDTLYRGLTTAG